MHCMPRSVSDMHLATMYVGCARVQVGFCDILVTTDDLVRRRTAKATMCAETRHMDVRQNSCVMARAMLAWAGLAGGHTRTCQDTGPKRSAWRLTHCPLLTAHCHVCQPLLPLRPSL